MINRTHPVHRHSRETVHCLMVYGNEEFVANGTVLDVTATGFRAEGPMPVHPGMRLNISVWLPEKPEGLHVEDATVLWVKGYEFGLTVPGVNPVAQELLTQVVRSGRGVWLVPQAA